MESRLSELEEELCEQEGSFLEGHINPTRHMRENQFRVMEDRIRELRHRKNELEIALGLIPKPIKGENRNP